MPNQISPTSALRTEEYLVIHYYSLIISWEQTKFIVVMLINWNSFQEIYEVLTLLSFFLSYSAIHLLMLFPGCSTIWNVNKNYSSVYFLLFTFGKRPSIHDRLRTQTLYSSPVSVNHLMNKSEAEITMIIAGIRVKTMTFLQVFASTRSCEVFFGKSVTFGGLWQN